MAPSNVVVNLDWVHAEVHAGKLFESSYKTDDASPLADNAVLLFLIVTGERAAHFVFAPATGGEGEIEFLESPTTSNSGTALARISMNRTANKFVPTTIIYRSPTVTGNGTQLIDYLLPGGNSGPSRAGGIIRTNTEWILARNTSYLLRVINRAGNAQQAGAVFQWYEEDDF